MPTGLSKTVIDFPFKGGLTEKIHPDMAPPEGMYLIENAELDKVGSYRRRRGFDVLSSAIIASVSSIGAPKKVLPKDDEVCVITEDLGFLGSGGGGGASGATLWTYSPETTAWRDNGHVSSITIDRFSGLANGQTDLKSIDCTYINGSGKEYVVGAYTQNGFAGANAGVYVMAYDITSRAMVLEPTIIDTTHPGFTGKTQVVGIGRYAVVLFRTVAVGSADLCAVVYDAVTNAVSSVIVIFSASAKGEADKWSATTDGTNLYLAYVSGASIAVEKFVVTGSSISSIGSTSTTAGVSDGVWVSTGGGILSITWSDLANGIFYWAVTAGTMVQVAAPITHYPDDDETHNTYSTHVSSGEVAVFWDCKDSDVDSEYFVRWRWVKNASTAPASRANTHQQSGVQVGGAPFVFNSRVFCPLTGISAGTPSWENDATAFGLNGVSNFGHCICEVNSNGSAEDSATGNPYSTFLPVAVWGRDISRYSTPGLGGFGGASDRYLATVRQARVSDAFFSERGNGTPVAHTTQLWSIDIMRVQFNDQKRWHHAEGVGQTLLAGALPYVYDGMNTHECGFIFRPAIMSISETGTGSFLAGNVRLYKLVYEWEDVRGARWFSDTSITASYTLIADNKSLEILVRVPSITAKPLGGFQFTGRVKMNLYRAEPESPDEFRLLNSATYMIFDSSGAGVTRLHAFTDSGVNDLEENERAYTFGGELNNVCAPPCRSIVQHRDRFFAIDTEDNYLWYTKPFTKGRGVEWAREQRLPLPSRGMALASVEGSLLVYTERQVLVLEGQGPAVTGQPADAYSRLMVLSQDQGCSEVNAAWRFPGGSLFRTTQGLWSVAGNFGLNYVGAMAEDLVRSAVRFIDASVDESQGCLAMLATDGSTYFNIRFWYDTGRWSVDRYSTVMGSVNSSMFHKGEFYLATGTGYLLKRSIYRYLDGLDADTADTSDVYWMKVRTGRFRLDSLASFKRLWRVLASVRSDDDEDAVARGGTRGSSADVRLTVETQGAVDGSSTYTFSGEELTGGMPKLLRAHVKFQKGQTYRFTLEEVANLDTKLAIHGPFGYTFLGLGLELGMKRGASKQAAGRSL